MQFYSRSNLKNLLFESIVGQTYFLEEIYKIAKANEKKGLVLGKITSAICDAVDDDEIGFIAARSLSGKQAKKTRNVINTKIHKEVSKINGYDNSPFSLKGIKHFYDSIIKYTSEKIDISLDECLLAADFFMKAFYPICDDKTKELVDTGEYSLDQVFVKTEYFTSFVNNETGLGILRDYSCYEIYEDEKVSIVYPKSPLSFVNYIDSQNISINNISWCTRTPITWYSYNKDQYVMILRDKRSESTEDSNYIVSLKVRFDGTIDYTGTCDRYNKHMSERSVRNLLDDSAHKGIIDNINVIDIRYDVNNEDVVSNIENLANIGRYKELSELLSACLVIIKDLSDLTKIFQAAKESLDTKRFVSIVLETVVRLYFDTFNLEDENNENNEGGNLYEDRFDIVAKSIESIGQNAVSLFMSSLYSLAKKNGHPRYTTALLSFNYFENYSIKDFVEDQNISMSDICFLFEKSCKNKSPRSFSVLIDAFQYLLENVSIEDDQGDIIYEVEDVPYEFFEILSSSNCFREYVKTFKVDIVTNYFLRMPKRLQYLSKENPVISAIIGIEEQKVRDQIKDGSNIVELQNLDLAMLANSIERRITEHSITSQTLSDVGKSIEQDMSASFGTLSEMIDEDIFVNVLKSDEYIEKIANALQSTKRVDFCASIIKTLIYSMNDSELNEISNSDFVKKINILFQICTENAAGFSSIINAFDSIHKLISFISSLRMSLQIKVDDLDKDFINEINMYIYKENLSTLDNIVSSSLHENNASKSFKIRLETCIQLSLDEKDMINLAASLCRVMGSISTARESDDSKKGVVDDAILSLKPMYGLEKNIDYALNYKSQEITNQLSYLNVFDMISFMSDVSVIKSESIINFYSVYTKEMLKAPISLEEVLCIERILSLILKDIPNHIETIQKIIYRISFRSKQLSTDQIKHVLATLEVVLQKVNDDKIKLDSKSLTDLLNSIYSHQVKLCVTGIMTNMILHAKDKNSLDITIGKINPANHINSGALKKSSSSAIDYYIKCFSNVVKNYTQDSARYIGNIKKEIEKTRDKSQDAQFKDEDPFEDIDSDDFDDYNLYEYLKLKISPVI